MPRPGVHFPITCSTSSTVSGMLHHHPVLHSKWVHTPHYSTDSVTPKHTTQSDYRVHTPHTTAVHTQGTPKHPIKPWDQPPTWQSTRVLQTYTQNTEKMSDIKLSYFNLKGRAEISRLILSYSGVTFTDERLTGAQFGAIKSSLPYGQMPLLDYKGQLICQSISIAR